MSDLLPETGSETWLAPAKVNLFLHLIGQRSDGYHELQTVFQLLDYGDILRFRVTKQGEVQRSNDIAGLAPDQDIVVKAARLLKQHGQTDAGVSIQIDKRLPMGGGVGGGSSDAATTLLALNRLWQLDLSLVELAGIGLQLGADVPVFVYGHSAWGEGVGERLTPVELPPAWFVVLTPPVHATTAELFSDPELTRDAQAITIRDYFAGASGNAFEPVVRKRYPDIAEALDWLSAKSANKAKLSGTGASVFVSVADRDQAEQIQRQVPSVWSCFVAEGLNVSPALIQGGY